jgi:hypothetical protein
METDMLNVFLALEIAGAVRSGREGFAAREMIRE